MKRPKSPTEVLTRAPAGDPQKAAHVRLLNDRIRQAKESLGALDFERAKLDAQAQQIRQSLARDLAESEATLTEQAKADGFDLSQPGWRYDLATGQFSR